MKETRRIFRVSSLKYVFVRDGGLIVKKRFSVSFRRIKIMGPGVENKFETFRKNRSLGIRQGKI